MSELIRFVLQSGMVAKLVLMILFIMSVTSWGIIIEKTRLFRKIKIESGKFQRLVNAGVQWDDCFNYSREFKHSPVARIFRKHYHDLKTLIDNSIQDKSFQQVNSNQQILPKQQVTLVSQFHVAIADEMAGLEKHIIFLATTVSVSPFLGLFGTVWGVMTAFMSMGVKGSADITAVGPGIAEALITTLAGLGVAIPALVGHNFFINKLRQIDKELDNFITNLIIMVERKKSQ